MTPLVAGRAFEWSDVYQRRPVALVSDNFARAEWGSAAAAIGKRISLRQTGPWLDVVGVVKDVRHNGLNEPAPETVILPPIARTRQPRSWSGANAPGRRGFWTSCGGRCGR